MVTFETGEPGCGCAAGFTPGGWPITGSFSWSADSSITGISDSLGPTQTVTVEGFLEEETTDQILVDMVLFDWPQVLYRFLRHDASPAWPVNTIWPHNSTEVVYQVSAETLVHLALDWVHQDDVALSEAYATAVEPPAVAAAAPNPSEELLQQLLTQVQATAVSLASLQEDVTRLKQQPTSGETVVPATSSGALAKARALVGPGPRTRPSALRPSQFGRPQASTDLVNDELDEED